MTALLHEKSLQVVHYHFLTSKFIERCQPVHISKPFFFSAKHHNYTQFTLTSSREILGQSVQIAKEYMVVSSLCFADQSNRLFRVVDWE